jgi:pantoate--beta-alanine ligase
MQQIESREQVHSITRRWRREGLRVALVPTMGNLHAGHLALVKAARHAADRVVTSIYVNPTQFGEGEDFASYPRTLDTDRESLRQAGCDLLFVPDHSTMYPAGLDDAVRICATSSLAGVLEGERRPGHFDGVVSVVARLFNLVGPDCAFFGEKDYQQLLVIRQMAGDLGYGIRIESVPTVRESSGLAMSSRNNYLQPAQKEAAAALNQTLMDAAARVGREAVDPGLAEREAEAHLLSLGMPVDYVAIRRSDNLAKPDDERVSLRVLAAAWCGQTRLIDNVEIKSVGILPL